MKIIVSHVYSSDNKGDAALVSVLLNDIKRHYKNADVTLLTFEQISQPTYEGAAQMNSFMYHALTRYNNKIVKLFYACYVVIATLIWARLYRAFGKDTYLPSHLRRVARAYAEADLIIPVGGGYIRSGHSLASSINLFLLLHPLYFSTIIKKPTILYTQSVGPFYRRIERKAVASILRKMNLVILREEISKKLLTELGVIDNVVRSVDSGFLLKSKRSFGLREKLGINKDTMLVGVTVRKWLDKAQQHSYETAIARSIDYLIDKYGATIVFIPQVTATFHNDDDREASKDVYGLLKNPEHAHVITNDIDHYDVKAMYDELDYIIGTRFHSVIFSLTSYVPAVAIEYEHKTSGIMLDLDLSEWVVKIEDSNPKMLEKKIDELIEKREEYVTHLKDVLPNYIEKAEQAIVLADEAYQRA